MSRVCEQDEEAVDMEDFIDSGGLEEDTNTLELPDQQHSKVDKTIYLPSSSVVEMRFRNRIWIRIQHRMYSNKKSKSCF